MCSDLSKIMILRDQIIEAVESSNGCLLQEIKDNTLLAKELVEHSAAMALAFSHFIKPGCSKINQITWMSIVNVASMDLFFAEHPDLASKLHLHLSGVIAKTDKLIELVRQ